MKRKLLAFLTCLGALFTLSVHSNAQTRLIYFWDFNSVATGTTYHYPTLPPVNDDYNIGSSVATMTYEVNPIYTVSSTYATYYDITTSVAADYDTVNQQPIPTFSVVPGNWFRARNPSDSMELVFAIPTTNYQNITITYGTESSSTTSGDSAQIYSYSLNGGVTWLTAGLSVLDWNLNAVTYDTFRRASVTITDPGANNNPNLQFRIITMGRNHGTSGNNRYDNISVMGDTILPYSGTLVYFWSFNNFDVTDTFNYYPNWPHVAPDYFIHDSSKARVQEALFPGTSAGYGAGTDLGADAGAPALFDSDPLAFGAPDYDTVNDNFTIPASTLITFPVTSGEAYRMRNPSDSEYLYIYMPTVNYKDIQLAYGMEFSSTTSGDSSQVFAYSVDSGATWRTDGLSIAYAIPLASKTMERVNIAFTDPATNNNSKLIFRINNVGRNTGSSGNIRLDNISVTGDSIISPLPTITTTPAAYGPYCSSAANPLSVPFTTTGIFGQVFSVQISNSNGLFPTNTTSNIIGTGSSSPISATIPALTYAPGTNYRIRVVSGYPNIYGTDNGSNITLANVAEPITGPTNVCTNANTTLADGSPSGVWASSNNAVATVGSVSGVLNGITVGTSIITYSVGVGCIATQTMVVLPSPASILGTTNACPGTSATLTDVTTLGAWSSNAMAVATVGTGSGIFTGVAAGTAVISYTVSTGCFNTQTVTINPLPPAITGTTTFCQGLTTTLSDVTPGGSWSSSNTSLATVGTTGIVTGIASGAPVITYTLPTGCITTIPLNISLAPAPISGGPNGCVGATTALSDPTAFGEWVSSHTSVATIGSSTGVATGVSIGTAVISYILSSGCLTTQTISINSLPSGITGTAVLCAGATTTLSDITPGGSWSSSNTAIATVSGSSTGTVTSVAGAGGNPMITYTLPSGCSAFVTLTVNPSPGPIAGATTVYCIGTTTTLSDGGAGTWSSSNTAIATIGSASGIVTSVSPGVTNITYTLPAGCYTTGVESVNPSAAPITGASGICNGSSYNFTDATAFGEWASSNTTVATIGSGSGIITAMATGTTIITYGLSTACTTTKTITVNPLPAGITGTMNVCEGLSTTLSDPATGGTWSASDGYLASVGATSGTVTGLVASILNISYTLPTGCSAVTSFTINPTPAAITGTDNVCVGLVTALNETTTGGSWISGNTALATIGSTGVVTGISAGAPVITYELPTGCIATVPVTVNPLPAAIAGSASVCMGLTITLTDASTGGTWATSDVTLATITSGTGVLTGVGAGTPFITYTLPTGCITTTTITVNPRYPIAGTSIFCTGLSTTLTDAATGGTWTSSNTAVATIGSSTGVLNSMIPGNTTVTYVLPTGCTETENVTVISLPAAISGTTNVCAGLTTTLTDAGGGGWYSSNPAVAYVGFGTGIVTGVTAGTTVITYSLGTSCINTTVLTVNPLPNAITGIAPVCQSSDITLADAATGGSWVSSNSAVATIGTVSGVVTGVSAGTTAITYTLPTGCIITNSITVNPILPVTGLANVCQGMSITLADAVTGGAWHSSNIANATIGTSSGIVNAIAAGTTVISYTMPTGCMATATVTINPLAAITGTTNVCQGLNTTLANINAGGTWTSSNIAVSTVDPVLGIVSGVAAGADTITYTLPTGCVSTTSLTVNPLPAALHGLTGLCTGLSYTYTDTTVGGSWSGSNATVATVGSSTGIVLAVATGNATITYTLPTGCLNTATVVVNSTPRGITGIDAVCVGGTVSFSDTGSGTWSSSNSAVAAIGSISGSATGISGGLALITYTVPTGCLTTTILTVNPVAPITGANHVCAASTTTLVDTVSGGTWSSTATSVAGVAAGTGLVTGVSAGTATIVYTLPTGCNTSTSFTVYAVPATFTVSGGGSYCAGRNGVTIDLSGSQAGMKYLLYDTTVVGSPLAGTGSVLSFNAETRAGSYNVVAIDTTTACMADMDGFATVVITATVTPSVSISNGIGDTVCPEMLITYVATPVNGGIAPSYFWKYNGASTSVYTNDYNVFPSNGDVIEVFLVSNALCATPDTVSKSVTIAVDSIYEPSIHISETPGTNVKPGESVTFTAAVTGAGPRPAYQWYIDGVAVPGATSLTYTTTSLTKGNDTVTCNVKGTGLCGALSSAFVVMDVSNLGVPSITSGGHFTLFPNPNTGSFTLKGSLATSANQEVSVEITDMLGQVVYKNKVMAQNGNINEQISLGNNLANGMYMLNLSAGSESDVFHFVIGQ